MEKRKARLIIGCLTSAAVIIILFLSLEIASRDFVCGACHINAKTAETWKTSPHAKTHCTDCHAPSGYFARTVFVATHGTSNLFINLFGDVKLKDGAGRPDNKNCLQCHKGASDVITTMGIKIPHKTHAVAEGSTCSGCHFDIAHATPGVPVRPPMVACLECHDKKKISRECELCHTATASATADGAPGYRCAECHINGGKLDELSPPPPAAPETGG